MRTAVLCFYQAYPPVGGAAAVSWNVARFMRGERLLVQLGREAREERIEGVRIVTIPAHEQSRIAKLGSIFGVIRAMTAEVGRFHPDRVILEGASWASYLWMLSRAIRRAIPDLPIVYHSHNVEYQLRLRRNGRAVAEITRWAERRLMVDSDIATSVSEVDRDHFRKLYGVDTVRFPNGVDLGQFSTVSESERARVRAKYGIGDHAVIFSGSYAFPPNRAAVDFLVHKVMPVLLADIPDVQLVVTASDLPYREPWLLAPGIVPCQEFPALLSSCRAAAAPVFSGSGTRLKILEAMAAGVPVVATRKAAEGLPVVDGEHLLLAEGANAFAESLRRAMEDAALAAHLGEQSQRLVRREFDWPVIITRLEPELIRCAGPIHTSERVTVEMS